MIILSSIIKEIPKDRLEKIVSESFYYKEVLKKLGYFSYSGSLQVSLKERLQKENISTEHFKKVNYQNKKTFEEIFCENSEVSQHTLRDHYRQGNYSNYICSICGQEPFWNGNDLTLILDHINGNNHDNKLENLRWVCPNCNAQLPTTGAKNIKRKEKVKVENLNYCRDCGAIISKTATQCIDCFNKSRKEEAINNKPVTREELKFLIRTEPFTKIGKMFEISDNAIRKWCKLMNLPSKKTEINNMTDEEWEKI